MPFYQPNLTNLRDKPYPLTHGIVAKPQGSERAELVRKGVLVGDTTTI